jgi:hypothetical protein
MKKITILSIAAIFMALNVNAKVWRVNNRPLVDADFTTLQAAIDSASWGDTLYIEGSPNNYGNGTFDKKLTVIGAGYWHDQNDSLQAYEHVSHVKQLAFNEGSQGSKITGLYVYYGNYSTAQNWKLIAVNTDSITIERNYIYGYAANRTTYNGFAIFVNTDLNSCRIQQNWIQVNIDDYSTSYPNGTVFGIYFSGIPENTTLKSNFIRAYKSSSYGGYYSIHYNTYSEESDMIIANNVLWGNLQTQRTFIVNNILLSGSYNNGQEDQTANNLCSGTQFPNTGNNQQNVVMDSVFVDYDKYVDNGYLLKPNSPAKNAGINGGDCGVFSFDYDCEPYILSGMPAIPTIIEATYTTVGTTELPVNIKAKSNN